MSGWRDSACRLPKQSAVPESSRFLVVGKAVEDQSPIDGFYEAINEIIRLSTPPFLAKSERLGPLMLVAAISSTEDYFREVLARSLSFCVVAQKSALDAPIKLGAVVWHRQNPFARGAFEHESFASEKKIKDAFKKYLAIAIDQKNDINGVLQHFDQLCQLRHGIVHADCQMPGKNAVALGLNDRSKTKISVGYEQLQEVLDVCTTLVVSANNMLFEEFASRWASRWPDMVESFDRHRNRLFRMVWNTFYSTHDEQVGEIAYPLTMRKCRNRVAKEFGLSVA